MKSFSEVLNEEIYLMAVFMPLTLGASLGFTMWVASLTGALLENGMKIIVCVILLWLLLWVLWFHGKMSPKDEQAQKEGAEDAA